MMQENILEINRNGLVMKVNGDKTPQNPDFWQSENWESDTFRTLRHFLDRQHSYIDVGAWIGPTVLYGCQLAKRCYAVEPDKVALEILKENIALNGFKNITVFEGAVWGKNGKKRLGLRGSWGSSMSSFLKRHPKKTIKVDCVTLQTLFERYNITDCNFMKMDVEGAEAEILKMSGEFLKEAGITLHLSVHKPFFKNKKRDTEEVIKFLKRYKHLYLDTGEETSADYLRDTDVFLNFIATDRVLSGLK